MIFYDFQHFFLRGLFGMYHTSRSSNTYITNVYILLLTISLTVFFQVLFGDHIFHMVHISMQNIQLPL